MADGGISRRGFLKGSALVGAAALSGRGDKMAEAQTTATQASQGEIPRRPLGKTGVQVSAIGVGGYHLGSAKSFEDANNIVAQAIDAGINFFDCAWDYHDGKSEEWLGRALVGQARQGRAHDQGVHARPR